MVIVFAPFFLMKNMHLEFYTIEDERFPFIFLSGQKLVTVANIETQLIGDLIKVKDGKMLAYVPVLQIQKEEII